MGPEYVPFCRMSMDLFMQCSRVQQHPMLAAQFVKCGFAGDVSPRATFPCVVGRPLARDASQTTGAANDSAGVVVGDECVERAHELDISYPMSHGLVQSWADMLHVWDHTFERVLELDAGARARSRILLTEPPMNPLSSRQRLVQVMFERYGFASVQVQVQAVLTLYAQGYVTGLVVDIGDGVSHIIPVVEGCTYPHLSKRLDIAGRDVTARMADLLQRRGHTLNRPADFDAVRRMKERLCYVAADYQRELQLARETTCVQRSYALQDGRTLRVGAERFRAPEALFRPGLLDVESPGVAELAFRCVQETDIDNRMALYQHVVLSGGTTLLPGLPTRLERDIRALYLQHVLHGDKEGLRKLKLRVEVPPRRKHAVFSGGSVLADIMRHSDEFWVSREQWLADPKAALAQCVRL